MFEPDALRRQRRHPKRRDAEWAGGADTAEQIVGTPVVHQEADGAEVHPEHGQDPLTLQHLVKRLEQEAVSAKRHHLRGILERHERVGAAQLGLGGLRGLGWGGEKGGGFVRGGRHRDMC